MSAFGIKRTSAFTPNATHSLAGGPDLPSLQELLDHASLSSVQVYAAVDAAHLMDVYNSAHPRA